MSSTTGKSKRKTKSTRQSKDVRKLKNKKRKPRTPQTPEPHELTEDQRLAKETEAKLKAEEEQKEHRRLEEITRANEEAHNAIINDYIAKFVDGAVLQNIQTMEDVDELEEAERSKPRHQLTSFLEVLLESEPNKQNLHRILTDQFLEQNADFEALITTDEIDWNETDYGALNYDEWELDDNEVKRLMNEWRRNVLDPVMATYLDGMLPWAPQEPMAVEIYDDLGDDDDDDHHTDQEEVVEEPHDPEEKQDIIETNIEDQDIPQLISDDEEDKDDGEDIDMDDEDNVSDDAGSFVSVSEDEDDEEDEEDEDDEDTQDEDDEESEESQDDDDDEESDDDDDDSDDDDDDDDDDEDDDDDMGSADSADSGDDIDWSALTHEEALEKDKYYLFGKRIEAGTFPQYVLQNIPSRFMAVHMDWNEQTHMVPGPWKRIFYHYAEDKISLPPSTASKTVEAEYNKIDFSVIEWDPLKEEKDGDDCDEEIGIIDKYLQEIPDNYDDILDSSLEVRCEAIYKLRKFALEKAVNDGKKVLGEMMQNYVDKFHVCALPHNILSDTYKHPRFIADFSKMKSYNEYGLLNMKMDKLMNPNDSDDSDDDDIAEMNISRIGKITEDIAWAPWWTYRIRIWAKMTHKEIAESNQIKEDQDNDSQEEDEEEEEEESESESSSDYDDESDDDDDAAEKEENKKEAKRKAKEEKKRLKLEAKEEKKRLKLLPKEIKKKNGRYFSSKLSSDDRIGYKLICDHFVVQNDHCFGRPTRFYWDEAIHEDNGGGLDHRFDDFLFNEKEELGWNWPDFCHPLYIHPAMDIKTDLSDGMFCNGLSFVIGRDTPYDLISIDVRVPPVAQLYNISTVDAWKQGWGLCSISPYKVWRDQGEFQKGVFTYGDRLYCEADDLDDAFIDNDGDAQEGLTLLDENLPWECNAFYFNNDHLRLFDCVDPLIPTESIQSDGWTAAIMDIFDSDVNHGKDNDEWVVTVGFTHPRPHNQPAVILWKNNSLEIRLKSEYDYVNSDERDKTGHMYKCEYLEVYLIYMTRGGKRDKVLSVPIRRRFNEDYIIYDGNMVVVGDECVESHVFILSKSKEGLLTAFLNGTKVMQQKIRGNYSTHLLQKSKSEINNNLPFNVLIGHKRTGDDGMGKSVDFFHGYIYDVAIFPYSPHEFEINLIYRSMKLDHDLHLRSHWNRQRHKFKRENANLNFKIDDYDNYDDY